METTEDELDYISQVMDRCYKLIDSGIWGGIKKERLDGWVGCLSNCNATLLSAYLLDNLTYRSREQYSSLLDTVFQDLSVSTDQNDVGTSLVSELASSRSPTSKFAILIAPVIGDTAPPTKSGPYILRLAQRRYQIKNDWLSWPQKLVDADSISHLYLIDDFCGTGKQFSKFLNNIHLDEIRERNSTIKVSYLVTTIHTEGLNRITKNFPFLDIKYAEQLKEGSAVLSDLALARYQIAGFSEKIKHQYAEAIRLTGLPTKGAMAVGFGGLSLAYGFSHATPNNTLPIFWMETPTLTPLLDR